MADVFLSYKREEAQYARSLMRQLEAMGYAVWWDEKVQCAGTWQAEIDDQLANARCIIVLWSRRSVTSPWVAHEAAHAMTRNVFCPAAIEEVSVPAPYGTQQAASLSGWDGTSEHVGFSALIGRVSSLVGPAEHKVTSGFTAEEWPKGVWPRRVNWPIPERVWTWSKRHQFSLFAIAVTLIAAGFVYLQVARLLDAVEATSEQIAISSAAVRTNSERVSANTARVDENTLQVQQVSVSLQATQLAVMEVQARIAKFADDATEVLDFVSNGMLGFAQGATMTQSVASEVIGQFSRVLEALAALQQDEVRLLMLKLNTCRLNRQPHRAAGRPHATEPARSPRAR